MSTETLDFNPDYCVPPGYTLREWMQENNVHRNVMAKKLTLNSREVTLLVVGGMAIDKSMSESLEIITGIPRSFWQSRETRYRAFLESREK